MIQEIIVGSPYQKKMRERLHKVRMLLLQHGVIATDGSGDQNTEALLNEYLQFIYGVFVVKEAKG